MRPFPICALTCSFVLFPAEKQFSYLLVACNHPKALGMENRKIQDFQITASSEWNANHGPTNGRLNFKAGGGRTGAWSAKTNDANQWFQVDFRKKTIVSEIYIQGRQDYNQWVTSYTVSYSNDGKVFRPYTQNGQLKVKGTNRRPEIKYVV